MAKRKNPIKTVTLTLSTTEKVVEILEWLVQRGIHGKNPAEVAERLLTQRLSEFLPEEKFGQQSQGSEE